MISKTAWFIGKMPFNVDGYITGPKTAWLSISLLRIVVKITLQVGFTFNKRITTLSC